MATITIIFLLLILLQAPLSFSSPANFRHKFSKIYAFGDSFTDTGNTHSATGPHSFGYVSSPPYGSTFFHHSTNRYSDGRLVIDFLATDLSLPFLPPFLARSADFSHGVNFAVAGSTAIEHDFFVKNNMTFDITPQSLMTQLSWFERHLQERECRGRRQQECEAAVRDALFWVGEIGVNDYAYSVSSPVPPNHIRDMAVKNMVNFLKSLTRTVMKNPSTFGFTETFKTCCGSGGGTLNFDLFTTCGSPDVPKACADPAKFVNWDGVHLTEAMYKVVSGMFFNGGYCKPAFDVLLRRE